MLLGIDVGNTNTVLGVYEGEELICHWRITTNQGGTADEYGILVQSLFTARGIKIEKVDDIIISCVVPPVLFVLITMAKRYFQIQPLVVEPGIKTGMPIHYDNPKEVGADRIVNAVAAYEKFHRGVIVVDFGTATTFDCISDRGEYLGGAIAPGIRISSEALFQSASKLPRVEIARPKSIVGKNTIHSIQAGIFFGYIGLVDEIVTRLIKELKTSPVVLATGGLARLIAPESTTISEIDPMLTLKGLRIIHERNQEGKRARNSFSS